MNLIKVVICDDMYEMREYFKVQIDKEPDMSVVGTAGNEIEAIEVICREKPDVALIDMQMDCLDSGVKVAKEVNERCPDIKVVILTVHQIDELILNAYCAGVADYVLKDVSTDELFSTIRKVYNSGVNIRPFAAGKILTELSKMKAREQSLLHAVNIVNQLTKTEMEILLELNDGFTRKQIAEKRCVELVTIETHIGKILKKFGFKRTKDLLKELNRCQIFQILELRDADKTLRPLL